MEFVMDATNRGEVICLGFSKNRRCQSPKGRRQAPTIYLLDVNGRTDTALEKGGF